MEPGQLDQRLVHPAAGAVIMEEFRNVDLGDKTEPNQPQRSHACHAAKACARPGDEAQEDVPLALRAVTRLDYSTLLEYTPDPVGDWATGRHERLARAELASVGLRP